MINSPSFSIDLSAASSALGGVIDNFPLFGLLGGTSNTYSYEHATYLDVNGGVIFAQSVAGNITTPTNLESHRGLTDFYIANVTEGVYPNAAQGDLASNGFADVFLGVGLLNNNGDIANLYRQWLSDELDSSGDFIDQVTQIFRVRVKTPSKPLAA